MSPYVKTQGNGPHPKYSTPNLNVEVGVRVVEPPRPDGVVIDHLFVLNLFESTKLTFFVQSSKKYISEFAYESPELRKGCHTISSIELRVFVRAKEINVKKPLRHGWGFLRRNT